VSPSAVSTADEAHFTATWVKKKGSLKEPVGLAHLN
jgi:hypothetical protein